MEFRMQTKSHGSIAVKSMRESITGIRHFWFLQIYELPNRVRMKECLILHSILKYVFLTCVRGTSALLPATCLHLCSCISTRILQYCYPDLSDFQRKKWCSSTNDIRLTGHLMFVWTFLIIIFIFSYECSHHHPSQGFDDIKLILTARTIQAV